IRKLWFNFGMKKIPSPKIGTLFMKCHRRKGKIFLQERLRCAYLKRKVVCEQSISLGMRMTSSALCNTRQPQLRLMVGLRHQIKRIRDDMEHNREHLVNMFVRKNIWIGKKQSGR